MIYVSEDGISLKIALRQCVRINQHLTTLYFNSNSVEDSFDLSYEGDQWDACSSKYGKYNFSNLNKLCEMMEKIYNNRVFS